MQQRIDPGDLDRAHHGIASMLQRLHELTPDRVRYLRDFLRLARPLHIPD